MLVERVDMVWMEHGVSRVMSMLMGEVDLAVVCLC